MEYLVAVAVVAVLGAMLFAAFKIEPHWASKDGTRFLCNTQEMVGDQPVGRPRETQVAVLPDGSLHVSHKRAMRRRGSMWTLIGKSESPPRKREVYLARSRDGSGAWTHLAIRLPSNSRCMSVLDDILAAREVKTSPPGPGTAAPEAPPDRD